MRKIYTYSELEQLSLRVLDPLEGAPVPVSLTVLTMTLAGLITASADRGDQLPPSVLELLPVLRVHAQTGIQVLGTVGVEIGKVH